MTTTINPPNRPNLFRFAPSELSQDAFLAWLLSWSSRDAQAAVDHYSLQRLQEAACELLNLLLDKREKPYSRIVKVLPQWNKIDLYLHGVDENEKPFSLVIEDKTDTSEHDNQLERYQELAEQEKHGYLRLVYFKTGWWSPADERTLKGYSAIRRKDILDCLKDYRDCHPILADYYAHLKTIDTKIKHAEERALDRISVAEAFKSQAGLHAFLNAAFGPSSDRDDETWPKFGVGRGGRPWAHRSFGWKNILAESNVDEGFFWRADTRGGKAILSLRKYWDHGNLDKRKELAARRFQVYLKAVESTFKALNTGFVPSKLAARRSSYKEQELLLFTLGESTESEGANDPQKLAKAILNEIHPKLEHALLSARESMDT